MGREESAARSREAEHRVMRMTALSPGHTIELLETYTQLKIFCCQAEGFCFPHVNSILHLDKLTSAEYTLSSKPCLGSELPLSESTPLPTDCREVYVCGRSAQDQTGWPSGRATLP